MKIVLFLEIEIVQRKSSLMYYLCFNLYVFSVRLFFALEWKTVLRTHPVNGCRFSSFHIKCTIDGSEELLGFDKRNGFSQVFFLQKFFFLHREFFRLK